MSPTVQYSTALSLYMTINLANKSQISLLCARPCRVHFRMLQTVMRGKLFCVVWDGSNDLFISRLWVRKIKTLTNHPRAWFCAGRTSLWLIGTRIAYVTSAFPEGLQTRSFGADIGEFAEIVVEVVVLHFLLVGSQPLSHLPAIHTRLGTAPQGLAGVRWLVAAGFLVHTPDGEETRHARRLVNARNRFGFFPQDEEDRVELGRVLYFLYHQHRVHRLRERLFQMWREVQIKSGDYGGEHLGVRHQ